jgi:hypothetical protein
MPQLTRRKKALNLTTSAIGRLPLSPSGWSMSAFPAEGTTVHTNSPTGTLNLTGDGTNSAFADQQVTGLEIGRKYAFSYTASGYAFGALAVGTSQGDGSIINYAVLALGTNTVTFVATAASLWIRFGNQGATQVNVSGVA